MASVPESLTSRFRVTPNLIATVLTRPDGAAALKELLTTNHDTAARKREHVKRAIAVYKSLERAGVASRKRAADGTCLGVDIGSIIDGSEERLSVSFTSPLGPFAIEVIDSLDIEDPSYVLDVVSVIESITEDPMALLIAQEKAARTYEIGRLKAEGVPYEERIEQLDGITWPKPLAEVLTACITAYREVHPWVFDNPSPKSIVREMLESGETFASYVQRYKVERSEGLLLRYLTDVWRTLDRSLSSSAYTDQLEDVVDWLRSLLTATDASLIEEWERLSGIDPVQRVEVATPIATGPPRAWRTAVRTAAFGWVELLARRAYEALAERAQVSLVELFTTMGPYWMENSAIMTDADARSAAFFTLDDSEPGVWTVRQRLSDPEGNGEWGFTASVDLNEAEEYGVPSLRLVSIGRFGEEVALTSTKR